MNLYKSPLVISNDSEKSYTPYKARIKGDVKTIFQLRRSHIFIISMLLLSACGSKNAAPADATAGTSKPDSTSSAKTILFFGDSLTAGYGLDDPSQAFPGVVQNKIDSVKLPYHVVNAGVSGETSAGGRGRINWILKQKVDVFVLELGANDGLRGIPVSETTENLQAIIDAVKAKYPKAK
jgi:acyl-CoA thioesterase-1